MIKIFLSIAALSTTASAVVLTGSDSFTFGNTGNIFGDTPPIDTYSISTDFEIASIQWTFQVIDTNTFQDFTSLVANGFSFYESSFGALATLNTPPTGNLIGTNTGATSSLFNIADGESAFLAFEFEPNTTTSSTNYGWIELENNGGVLSNVGSAIAFEEPGIIVGTTTVVPEPSSSLLFFVASLFCFRRRR